MSSLFVIKNGYYIPLLYPIVHLFTGDAFLATIITLKAFPANYYFWFEDQYHFLPRGYNWIKQIIRFTDTGHIVSFMVWYNPEYLPLAFTVHFVITLGFWSGKIFMGMEDVDQRVIPDIDHVFETLWSAANHGLVLFILAYRIITANETCIPFTLTELANAYAWIYKWFVFIYIPWRMYTGDMVYSLLDYKKDIKKALQFVTLVHSLFILGHGIGFLISRC
jgi:hypothetical protein